MADNWNRIWLRWWRKKLKSKWEKYNCLKESSSLVSHLPLTKKLCEDTMDEFFRQFGEMILKPVNGSRGAGVIMVSLKNDQLYELHVEDEKKTFEEKQEMYNTIFDMIKDRDYIVQQRILLATINECPFDIRVIVQRKRYTTKWKVTGKVAKVAGQGFFVTNITRSKGQTMPVIEAIETSSLQEYSCQEIVESIERIAILTAKKLNKLYPNHRMYGLDMGIDQEGHVWIIEANTKPMLSHFRDLSDKSMYNRIIRYKKG